MIGYKIAKNGDKRVVVTLEIPSDALTNMNRSSVVVKETAKHRANKAKVLKIEDEEGNCYDTATSFNYNEKSVEYKVGELMKEPTYNTDPEKVCAEGIHFYLSRRVAELYGGLEKIVNGLFESWAEDGQKLGEVPYVDGKMHGLAQMWHHKGPKWIECSFVAGKRHGLHQIWDRNGQKSEEIPYVNGERHGLCRRWYENGQKMEEYSFVDGKLHGLYRQWGEDGTKMEEKTFVNGVRQ